MNEFLNSLDFGVAEVIMGGVGGITIKYVIDWLKGKFAIGGIWALLLTLAISCGGTAIYLAIFATLAVSYLVAYTLLVFLSSVFGHDTIKEILRAIQARQE